MRAYQHMPYTLQWIVTERMSCMAALGNSLQQGLQLIRMALTSHCIPHTTSGSLSA